jgi:F0F1-type ATP synthase membrane subunit c/vacuolar-type H+-ATPase subunit K
LMTVLGITLVESCAIYGLIIAFQIIGADNVTLANSLWAGLAVGIPGMVVGIVEWWVARSAMDALLRNPEAKNKILISMILFITLVESCAIYGLIIAFQILGK